MTIQTDIISHTFVASSSRHCGVQQVRLVPRLRRALVCFILSVCRYTTHVRKYALIPLLLISCSKDVQNTEITLTVWESYNNEEHKLFCELIDEFERDFKKRYNKDIKVKIGRVPFDGLLPKLKTAASTKTTPDICRVDVAHVVPLSYGKAILAIDELPGFTGSIDIFAKRFIDCTINSNIVAVKNKKNKWERHLFGIPDQTTTVCLFWNKKLFKLRERELKRANLSADRAPVSWDEFVEYGKILSDSKNKIYAFGMQNTLWWSFPFFNTFGAELIRRDKDQKYQYSLSDDNGIEALEYKINLYKKLHMVNGQSVRIEAGAWIPGAINPTQGFINEKYAMILTGPWDIKQFTEARIDFGISLIPHGPTGSSSTVGGTNMVIFKNSKYPKIALSLLLYVASPQYQERWCRELGQIPVLRETIKKLDYNKWKGLEIFTKQIMTAVARPQIPSYDKLEEIINPEMELALYGKKSPSKALNDAKKRIEKEILSLMNE